MEHEEVGIDHAVAPSQGPGTVADQGLDLVVVLLDHGLALGRDRGVLGFVVGVARGPEHLREADVHGAG
jgi:hypothetical protein